MLHDELDRVFTGNTITHVSLYTKHTSVFTMLTQLSLLLLSSLLLNIPMLWSFRETYCHWQLRGYTINP